MLSKKLSVRQAHDQCGDANCRTSHAEAAQVFLTFETLPGYLLERGFVKPADVVETPDALFSIHDYSSRNRAFKVKVPGSRGVLVKQGMNPNAQEFRGTVGLEGALLETVAASETFAAVRPFVPALLHHDRLNLILVSELVEPATTLTKYHLNMGDYQFPVESADATGSLLGAFHRCGADAIRRGEARFVESRVPSVWQIVETFDQRANAERSASVARFQAALRDRIGFLGKIKDLRAAWSAGEDLVHRDPRWDNFLLTHGVGPRGGMNLRMIDWELVSRGEAAWDVGFFLGEYLRLWALFAPKDAAVTGYDSVVAKQRFGFPQMHASAQAFWRAYARERGFTKDAERAFFERVLAHLPFNMLVHANESLTAADKRPWTLETAIDLAIQADADPRAFVQEKFGLGPEVGL